MIYPLYYVIPVVIIVLGAYTVAHWHLYRLVRQLFHPGRGGTLALRIGVVLLGLSPVLVAAVSRVPVPFLTPAVAMAGHLWLGFFIILSVLSIVVHAVLGVLRLAKCARGDACPLTPPPFIKVFPWMFAAALLFTLWGLFEARDVKVRTVKVTSGKLAKGRDHVRIVQISDVHFSATVGAGFARSLADQIRALKPDIIVSTGDLLDRGIMDWAGTAAPLAALKPPGGKWAVMGNHEFISGDAYSESFHRAAGFQLIRNQVRRLPTYGITLIGVDDPTMLRRDKRPDFPERELLRHLKDTSFRLVLKHQPFVDPDTVGRFDLMLAGHTHRGQIFPLRYLVGLIFKYFVGLYDLGRSSWLYVSRGTGTWGPPIRLFTPPEITVIDIRK